ncbi:MAG TPA: LysM peptidoglycan-binding domain-containing protein [Acidimicrobiales bacterium]|nr:LysM peptidoglycan-binding domain-containing protein [Acidimicrobiales bacterium]
MPPLSASDAPSVSAAPSAGPVVPATSGNLLPAQVTDVADSPAASDVSNFLKLEKAYLLILPPASPTLGGAAQLAGELAAAEAMGTGSQAASQYGGEAGSVASSGTQQAQAVIGGSMANKVTFLFNPQSYTISKNANWYRMDDPTQPETSTPIWRGGGPRSMSVQVLLDASYSENGGIQPDVDLLFACCAPTSLSIELMAPSPPFVMFGWGLTIGFLAFMKSVSAEYTFFRPDGTPLRARCQLEMEEIPIGLPAQNPTSGGRVRRTRTIVAGDTLQSVANREYGKPTMWRAIAEVNGIDDPLRVAPGTTLLIPPIDEAAALA